MRDWFFMLRRFESEVENGDKDKSGGEAREENEGGGDESPVGEASAVEAAEFLAAGHGNGNFRLQISDYKLRNGPDGFFFWRAMAQRIRAALCSAA
jgi:hypothetical protein